MDLSDRYVKKHSERGLPVLLQVIVLSISCGAGTPNAVSPINCRESLNSEGGAEVVEIYSLPDPKQNVERIKSLQWSSLSQSDQKEILNRASTATNSFEIGAYIEMAGKSKDPQWVPLLQNWVDSWIGI